MVTEGISKNNQGRLKRDETRKMIAGKRSQEIRWRNGRIRSVKEWMDVRELEGVKRGLIDERQR